MNENELTGLLESLRRMGSDDLNVEVKESATTLSRDVWETVSAFANTAGGIIVLGVSERAGFVPVENFETEKVLNQFVSGMGDAGGRGKLANPPKYTIERVELQDVIVLVITIEELDPSSKPCYVIERGAQGGSYKRIDHKDVPLSSTEVLALASYGRATVHRTDPRILDGLRRWRSERSRRGGGCGRGQSRRDAGRPYDRSGFLVDAPGNARRAGQTNEAGAPKYP